MIARGRFHISIKSLASSLLKLPFSSMDKDDQVEKTVKDFEDRFKLNKTYFMSSCRISFLTILESLKLKPGSEVLLSPITIPDMVNAIRVAGLTPVFVDMEKSTHAMSKESLVEKTNSNSKVVLLTYLSGLIPNVEDFSKYCKEEGLILIEDFSQLIGGEFKGRALGTIGDYGVASFSIGKTVTAQVGGCLVVNTRAENIEDYVKKNSKGSPKKLFFYKQLMENLKVEVLTSPFVFNLFTGPLLKMMAQLFPQKYLQIHKSGVVNRFDEKDLFFDDIPVKREKFNDELYFRFNNYMTDLFRKSVLEWSERTELRRSNLNLFRSEIKEGLKNFVADSFWNEEVFPVRAPFHVQNTEEKQIKLMLRGIDTGTYGLNLCHKESVFAEYNCELPVAEEIHRNCFFISLHEKVKPNEVRRSLGILEDILES